MTKVTTNQAGAISANVIRGVAGLSNEATVLLFRCLVLNERVSPSTDLGKELISAGTHNPIGGIRPTVARAHGKLIAHLVKESGALLAPMSEPTTIHQLGHKRVKGQSKVSAQAAAAEKIMRETAFMINPHVLGLAATAELSKEDQLVLQVCLTELLPPVFYFPVSYDYR
ncbi:MAG: hypothetical protein GY813_19020, partial [Halieaceae bacterium]|nr:hypothetical protein [Halieaceae bacterium]